MTGLSAFERLSSSRWASNVARLGGGTVLAQIIGVAATPLITRLYGPDELGLLGLFVSFMGVAGVGVGLRYELAIVSAEDEDESHILLALSLVLACPLALIGGLVMAALVRFDVLSYGALPLWSAAGATLALALAGAFSGLRFWYVRRAGFGTIARALVGQAISRAAVPVILGPTRVGWLGLMLGEIVGRGVGIGGMMGGAWPAVKSVISPGWRGRLLRALSRNWKYPTLVLPSSFVDALAVALPLPIVASVFGTAAAGQFLVVMRVAGWPAYLIATSVADVFHEDLTATARSSAGNVPSALWAFAKRLAGLGILVYVPAAALSPLLFGFVFGSRWSSGGVMIPLLSPSFLMLLVVGPLSRLLLVVNRQEWKFVVDIVCLAVPVVAFIGGHRAGLSFLACVALFSALNVAAYVFYFTLILFAARRFTAGAYRR